MDSQTLWYWIEKISLAQFAQVGLVWVWGASDSTWLMAMKRVFLLIPFLGLCVAYPATVVGLASTLFRSDRGEFVTSLLACWWDFFRYTFNYWGGVFQFALPVTVTAFGLARVLFLGTWATVQDFVLIPFRAIANIGNSFVNPGVPWIAVTLTLLWCIFEAMLFTYVTTPLVVDTLSNLTGDGLTENVIRVPLFGFMLFITLGSYSVLSTWTQALKARNILQMVKIGAIEMVALTVEVMFLYREFVDALVPWFAQHTSGNFELGIVGTIGIATMTWFGIRSISWFLFAAAGTPPIMAVIQGTGVEMRKRDGVAVFKGTFSFPLAVVSQLKQEMGWAHAQGKKVLEAFCLPPLQVIAASLNFVTMVLNKHLMFTLPFKSLDELKTAERLVEEMHSRPRRRKAA